jgi:D-serine deaminase-like pyridoxal phosphate-dependent protein
MLAHMKVADLSTPALVINGPVLARNLDTMAAALPGPRLRPHVKAHKSTALAREQSARGNRHFTAATANEIVGLARAGLGTDLLLANECLDPARLRAMAAVDGRVTIAVDSDETVAVAAASGIAEILVDVNVGMPRCGCAPDDAGRIADRARAAGLSVRGVMGYEGHVVGEVDPVKRAEQTEASMHELARAHDLVGGEIISGGGTGTFGCNTYASEIQAGSYALMDTSYAQLGLPFDRAFAMLGTVIHAEASYAVADCGLKAQSADHGQPTIDGATVWFCSDEHVTYAPTATPAVGARVFVWPAHVDPTIAMHERYFVADGPGLDAQVVDAWPIDLRGWDVDAR